MKILFVTIAWIPGDARVPASGGDISNRLLLEYLTERNDVQVSAFYAPEGTGTRPMIGPEPTIHFLHEMDERYHIRKKLSRAQRVVLPRAFRNQCLEVVKNFQPDVILTGFRGVPFALSCRQVSDAPIAVFVRAYEHIAGFDRVPVWNVKAQLRRALWGRYDIHALNKADLMIYNSAFLRRFYEKQGVRVPGTVSFPPVSEELRRQSTPCAIRNVMMVNGTTRKGGEIFMELARRHRDKTFHIVGGSAHAVPPDLDNVVIRGWVGTKEEMFAGVDLVLVPSQWAEPFGRIAVEALRLGKLVLVSNIGGLPEAVGQRKELLVPPSGVEAWDRALRDVMARPDHHALACSAAAEAGMEYTLAAQGANLELDLAELWEATRGNRITSRDGAGLDGGSTHAR